MEEQARPGVVEERGWGVAGTDGRGTIQGQALESAEMERKFVAIHWISEHCKQKSKQKSILGTMALRTVALHPCARRAIPVSVISYKMKKC